MPPERRFEPFVHLVDVTDSSVLVGWGGFFLDCEESGDCQVVDDEALEDPERRGRGTIGVEAPSYGRARVEVLADEVLADEDEEHKAGEAGDAGRTGEVVASGETTDANSVWVHGLEPDTAYRYRVVVDGEPWAEGPRWDWAPDAGDGNWDRSYDLRFRTHPPEATAAPVTFVALGDYGVGICEDEPGHRQQQVARTLEWLAANRPVRLVLSLGDNIYHGSEGKTKRTGDEDDDWYFTFYEPYRYVIDHLPLYPTVGNHDTADTESSDDRDQLADNFHLETRFRSRVEEGRASLDPGLFYRIQVGALLELVCVDTTWGAEVGSHYFDDDDHRRWLEQALPAAGTSGDGDDRDGPDPLWRIPFCHHPAYSAGPDHGTMPDQVDRLLPLYRRAGVPFVLSGHEHNFQHGRVDGFDYVIAGAAGKLDLEIPERWDEAGTRAWAQEPHCLLVEVDEDRVLVTPYGGTDPGREPQPLRLRTPAGDPVEVPLVFPRR